MGLLTLSAPQGVAGAGLVNMTGRGGDLIRRVRGPAVPGSQLASYLRGEIAWGVGTPLPIAVSWSTADNLVQGTLVPAAVQFSRMLFVQPTGG